MIPEGRRTPVEQALIDGLKDVVHCGDYGTLWVCEHNRRVHLTMGDSDGDTERGLTDFDQIAGLVWQALKPHWVGWFPPESHKLHGRGELLVIADEWHPVEQDGDDGWVEVGPFGREADELDELRAQTWSDLIRSTSVMPHAWKYSDRPELRASAVLLRTAAAILHEVVEITRPHVRPEQVPSGATPEALEAAVEAAIRKLVDDGALHEARGENVRAAFKVNPKEEA